MFIPENIHLHHNFVGMSLKMMNNEDNPLNVLSQAVSFVNENLKPDKAEDLSVNQSETAFSYADYPLKLKFKSKNFSRSITKQNDVYDCAKLNNNETPQQYNNLAWHHTLMSRNNLHQDVYKNEDSPIDMSMKSPSSIQKRPSVITCTPSVGSQPSKNPDTQQIETDDSGMCDPVIDEHFRRSLGKDYPFSTKKSDISSDKEVAENISITVDDHFAKALGETWHTLKKSNSADKCSKSPPSYFDPHVI